MTTQQQFTSSFLAIVSVLLCGASNLAQTLSNQQVESIQITPVNSLVEKYCFACHGAETQTAGINLHALVDQHPLVRNRETWQRVMNAVEVGKMPPATAPQPSEAERGSLVTLLTDAIDNFDYSTIDDPGFERMRRLTHRELDNTLRDLLAANFSVTDRFPSELTGSSGFDNSANTLFLESSLMERYIATAERVVELMLPNVPTTASQQRAHAMVFIATPGDGLSDAQAAEQILRRFMERAYRRLPTDTDIERGLMQFQTARNTGRPFTESIKVVL